MSDPATEPGHAGGADEPVEPVIEVVETAEPPPRPTSPSRRRSRWRLVALAGVTVLIAYYSLVALSLRTDDSGTVGLDQPADLAQVDRVSLELEAVEIDPSVGSFTVQLLPVPEGEYKGEQPGQLRDPLQIQVSSPGRPPALFDFPAGQLLDPVTATVTTRGRARGFPFDRAHVDLGLIATSGDEPVPMLLEMTDATEGWDLGGTVQARGGGLQVDVDADRELLPISFSLMYVAGTVVVALITVAVIGGAIARGQVGFDQVIWLGAMLVAIPAVRNEMPGVPPIGTGVDLFVFLPSVVVVALALLGAIVVLAINEAAAASAPDEE